MANYARHVYCKMIEIKCWCGHKTFGYLGHWKMHAHIPVWDEKWLIKTNKLIIIMYQVKNKTQSIIWKCRFYLTIWNVESSWSDCLLLCHYRTHITNTLLNNYIYHVYILKTITDQCKTTNIAPINSKLTISKHQ